MKHIFKIFSTETYPPESVGNVSGDTYYTDNKRENISYLDNESSFKWITEMTANIL